jgi:hypothetical protein
MKTTSKSIAAAIWIAIVSVHGAAAQGGVQGGAQASAQAGVHAGAQAGVHPGAQAGARCAVRTPDGLTIYGAAVTTTPFTMAALRALPSTTVRAAGHDGVMSDFKGVSLSLQLGRAGAALGDNLRGAGLTQYLVAEAADGYRAVLAYAEIDSTFRSDHVIVAYQENGADLKETGPLQLIVPGDLRHGRWVRQLECVRVAQDTGTPSPSNAAQRH